MKSNVVFKIAPFYIAPNLDEFDKLIISSVEEVGIKKQEGYYEKQLASKLNHIKAKRKSANKHPFYN